MTAELAAIILEQSPGMTASLLELGARNGLRFNAVTPQGWDSYRASFVNGDLDISILVDDSGCISAVWLEAPRTDDFWARMRPPRINISTETAGTANDPGL